MYFAEQSNLNDDDFVVYTAKKVSVSGTVNDDGTIDYDVRDGDQVVIYTRVWNETTLEYEYYAIDYDGMLVRAYMSGDNISWVGSKVNTMLWDFTEYHELDADGNETDVPNYYYELQNNYSGKYIAPQVTGDEFLAITARFWRGMIRIMIMPCSWFPKTSTSLVPPRSRWRMTRRSPGTSILPL